VRRSLVLRGYIYTEFVDEHYDAFLREIGPRVRSGAIRYQEDVVDGLDRAPEVYIGMLAGRRLEKPSSAFRDIGSFVMGVVTRG